jgi:hypothetical protein
MGLEVTTLQYSYTTSLCQVTSKLLCSLQHLCGEEQPPVICRRWTATPTAAGEGKASHLSCASSADRRRAGGQELVVVRHAAYCRSGNSRADKRVRRGRVPESTFQWVSSGDWGWLLVGPLSVCLSLSLCLLGSSAVLQNHEVVSWWHVRHHRRRGGSVALAPDAVPDMLQGQERGELSPSARDLHLYTLTQCVHACFVSSVTSD